MTDETEKLRELLAKATSGPWEHDTGYDIDASDGAAVAQTCFDDALIFRSEDECQANGTLIVSAVNALPGLLDTIERLQRELEEAREVIARIAGGSDGKPAYSAHDAQQIASAYLERTGHD